MDRQESGLFTVNIVWQTVSVTVEQTRVELWIVRHNVKNIPYSIESNFSFHLSLSKIVPYMELQAFTPGPDYSARVFMFVTDKLVPTAIQWPQLTQRRASKRYNLAQCSPV